MANVQYRNLQGPIAHRSPDIRCRALRKIGNNPQRSRAFEINLEQLVTNGTYTPDRQIGPVEVQLVPGAGRGIVAKEDMKPGSLLFVAEPVGSVLQGQLGQQLQPQHLMQHWQTSKTGLAAADRYKLSLLHNPDNAATPAPHVSFKDFSSSKASTKAKKASTKGFGAAAAPKQQSSSSPAAAGGVSELSDAQLEAVLRCNAYGDDHLDGALTLCRKEQQQSIIGVWPEFALLNHSCAPNTVPPVLLADRLLLRAAVPVPAGEQLTTSYLGLAGGMPREQRQQLLQEFYGFVCNCHRCKAEAQAPEDVTATLQAMHQWSSQIDSPELLQIMAASSDSSSSNAATTTAALTDLHAQAAKWVQQLEQQLEQISEPLVQSWLRASAYSTYALMLRTGEFLARVSDVNAAKRLAELVRVFAPASEPHLLLLADSAVRAAEAAQAGAAAAAPADTEEVRVAQLVRAVSLRYGEPRGMDVLGQLAGAISASLSPHWLGLIDLDGCMGLNKLMDAFSGAKLAAAAAAAYDAGAGGNAGAAAAGKRKVEMDLTQLGALGASAAE